MYVIIGATGNIGSVVADQLLSQGKKVRVIGRDQGRLKPFAGRGAEVHAGSVQDSTFLTHAFQGATAVFAMMPPNMQAQNIREDNDLTGESIRKALEASGVSKVVNLSSTGAEHESGTGPIAGLHRQEQRLNSLAADVLHLRPSYFMENFLFNIPMIRGMGIMGSAIRADVAMPMNATRDIGHAAARIFAKCDFSGKSVLDLTGPRRLTLAEATRILGAAIGKPDLPYVQFGYEDAANGMIGAGIPPDMARALVEMHRAMNEGRVGTTLPTPETSLPTTMEEFAKTVFAPIYHAG